MLEQVTLRFRLPFKFGGNITSRAGTGMFTLEIALEKINLGSIQIDFECRLYCDY